VRLTGGRKRRRLRTRISLGHLEIIGHSIEGTAAMRILSVALAFVALAVLSATCQAGVVGYAADDGDGAVICTGTWLAPGAGGEDAGTMLVQGSQSGPVGHIGRENLDDTARFVVNEDPTVKLHTIIDNDTTYAWAGYHVNIYMDKPFTISAVAVNYGDTSANGWWGNATVANATTPDPITGQYVGQVDYYGGDALAIGGSLDFSYKLTFDGTVHYCQEMIPTPAPEPSTIALGIGGLIGLLVVRRSFAR
jgi:hypothetical protein